MFGALLPDGVTIVALFVLVVAITFVVKAVRIVPQQHAWVVERLGRFGVAGPAGVELPAPACGRQHHACDGHPPQQHQVGEAPLALHAAYHCV